MALLMRCLLLSLMMPLAVMAANQAIQLDEDNIKAGLIYNFLKYTQWPDDVPESESITVCLLGKDDFRQALKLMQGRSVNRRIISVRGIETTVQAENCRMVYIPDGSRRLWLSLHEALKDRPILTVGDFDGFASEGGMIEFTRSGSRISVRINTMALKAVNLEMMERMLRLASAMDGTGSER